MKLYEVVIVVTFLLLCLLSAMPVHAHEIGATIGSYHFDRSQDYNERNAGIYGKVDNYFATVYTNSYRDPAIILGYQSETRPFGHMIRFGITIGVQYGYGVRGFKLCDADKYHKRISPILFPYVSIYLNRSMKINVSALPDVVGFSAGFEF